MFRYVTFGSFRLRFFSTFLLLRFVTLGCVWLGSVSFSYFTFGSFRLHYFSSFLSLRFVTLCCVRFGSASFSYVTFSYISFLLSFLYILLRYVVYGLVWFNYVTFGSVSLYYIMSMAPTDTLRYCLYPHMHHTSPQLLSLTNISRRHPSYPFNPVPAHNITACGICINTDEVLFSFVVVCAPQADKITIYHYSKGVPFCV
jgi:hypothetical protein